MTAPRDPERLIRAFLDDGPVRLPDRVLASVLDDVHRTRQRVVLDPRRILPMNRIAYAAAAVVAILFVGGLAVWMSQPRQPSIGAATSTPSPTAAPSSTASAALATPTPSPAPSGPPDARGPLTAGVTYAAQQLSQPLTFVLPPGFPAADAPVAGDPWADGHTVRIWSPGNYALTIHDDVQMAKDLCNDQKGLFMVPSDPSAISTWLKGSTATSVSKVTEIQVDGRTAYRWQVSLGPTCHGTFGGMTNGPEVYMSPNETHWFFAIPTGTDTILAITWGDGINDASIDAASERLIRSMVFP